MGLKTAIKASLNIYKVSQYHIGLWALEKEKRKGKKGKIK